MTPTKYDTARIQLLSITALQLYRDTNDIDSVSFFMQEIALFLNRYSELAEEARQYFNDKPISNDAEQLLVVLIIFNGIDNLINNNSNDLYNLALALVDDIDVSKEFTLEMRKHIVREIYLRNEEN